MFGPGGSFFVWVGRDEWREGRTVSLPAGRLQRLSFHVVCWEGVWHRRCGGCVVVFFVEFLCNI